MEKTVLNVFEKLDASADPQSFEACHKSKFDDNARNHKVVVKFSKRKDMVRVMTKKALESCQTRWHRSPSKHFIIYKSLYLQLLQVFVV